MARTAAAAWHRLSIVRRRSSGTTGRALPRPIPDKETVAAVLRGIEQSEDELRAELDALAQKPPPRDRDERRAYQNLRQSLVVLLAHTNALEVQLERLLRGWMNDDASSAMGGPRRGQCEPRRGRGPTAKDTFPDARRQKMSDSDCVAVHNPLKTFSAF